MHHHQAHPDSPAAGTVHLPAILAAAFAALIGAVAWGMIAWLTGTKSATSPGGST